MFFKNSKYHILYYICSLQPLFLFYNNNDISKEERIKLVFENCGPVLFKFGQLLSMRRDFLPKKIIYELEKLQDKSINFCPIKSRNIIETILHCSINDIFMQFNFQPIASASISQIHTAKIKDDTEIIIKVLKPGILKKIKLDILLIEKIKIFVNIFYSKNVVCIYELLVKELKKNIQNEVDLLIEAANIVKFKNNYNDSLIVYIPEIYWNFSNKNILFIERINGIKINNVFKLKTFGFNLNYIGRKYIELFFTQVFKNNFFHADMHPGNVFISTISFDKPKIILIDFGIMSSINKKDQNYMAKNILGFIKKDYNSIAKLHINFGRISKKCSIDDLESSICSVWEPIANKDLDKICFKDTITSLMIIAKRFNFQLQSQLLLFQKTLITVEGVTRYISPNINLWKIIKLILEKWIILNLILNNSMIKKIKKFF